MQARVHVVGAVVMGCSLVLGLVAPGSAADGRADPELEDPMRFRASLSLRNDEDYVRASIADTESFSDTSWGIPLTVEEAAEVNRRHDLQLALAPAESYAAAQEAFAGLYMDHAAGGVPVFRFTGDSSVHWDRLRELVPADSAFRLESVAWSWNDLDRLQDAVEGDRESLADQGVVVTRTAIVVSLNALVIGVADLDEHDTAWLRATYGPAVIAQSEPAAVADACVDFDECWPPKGGIKITQSGTYCTSGFLARREDLDRVVVVTAGHCVARNGGEGALWTHDGMSIGQAKKWVWSSYANSDVGIIDIYSSVTSTMSSFNRYMAKGSPVEVHSLTAVIAGGSQNEGFLVCRIGATSRRDCGTIVADDVTKLSCVETTCYPIQHLKEVDFDSRGGDSGGSVFSGVTDGRGYGLHVHSEPDTNPAPRHGWYTPLTRAESTLLTVHGIDITYCITASC